MLVTLTPIVMYLTVKCPPGSFFNQNFCAKCPDEHYQDLAGELSCKSCSENTVSSNDKTICIGMFVYFNLLHLSLT